MLGEMKTAYRDSWAVALKFPLLFVLPAAAEFAQHVVEQRIGMFVSLEGMKAAADNGLRMGFGILKVFSLFLLIYWVSRAMAVLRGATLRIRGDAHSARLFAMVLGWGLITSIVQLFGADLISPLVSTETSAIVGAVIGICLLLCDLYLCVWKVGSSLGIKRLGFAASFRVMHGNFWWSLLYFILMFLPAMVLHYLLNLLAVGRPAAAMWTMLGVDALTVGYLGIVLVAATYVMAERALARKGATLLP